jgi:hypothetical protein
VAVINVEEVVEVGVEEGVDMVEERVVVEEQCVAKDKVPAVLVLMLDVLVRPLCVLSMDIVSALLISQGALSVDQALGEEELQILGLAMVVVVAVVVQEGVVGEMVEA